MDPKLNQTERGVQVTHEGKDNWGKPYWHDRWHLQGHQPGNVSDACCFSYIDVSDEEKKFFTKNEYGITLFSDRGLGCAQLVIYHRRCALLDVRTADFFCAMHMVQDGSYHTV